MPKRRYDPETTRQDILDAAEKLFAERGFGDVSTAAIAKKAGVSQSQIHYHFETKRGLWEQVFSRRFDQYHALQSKVLDQGGSVNLDRLALSIRMYFAFFLDNPDFVKIMARAQLEDAEVKPPQSAELLRKGAEVVAQGQRAGFIRMDVPPEFVVLGFLSLVAQWFQGRGRILPDLTVTGVGDANMDDAYLDFILKVYLQGVTPPESLKK